MDDLHAFLNNLCDQIYTYSLEHSSKGFAEISILYLYRLQWFSSDKCLIKLGRNNKKCVFKHNNEEK